MFGLIQAPASQPTRMDDSRFKPVNSDQDHQSLVPTSSPALWMVLTPVNTQCLLITPRQYCHSTHAAKPRTFPTRSPHANASRCILPPHRRKRSDPRIPNSISRRHVSFSLAQSAATSFLQMQTPQILAVSRWSWSPPHSELPQTGDATESKRPMRVL